MSSFISCDWGTTNFRLRLIDGSTGDLLAEVKDPQGIAATHEKWCLSGNPDRLAFYQAFLLRQIQLLGPRATNLSLIISGMASSTLGMMELPYKDLPFRTNGRDLARLDLPPTPAFPHPLTLISGVRSPDDVMRGEETLLVGATPGGTQTDGIYIFPGTHSKHVRVKNGAAIGFKTYMTGEFFSLLSRHSILAASLTPTAAEHSPSFEKGVDDSRTGGLLHHAFRVRTNILFEKMSKEDNTHYLSGLLIGAELNELDPSAGPLVLVASGPLQDAYTRALRQLGHTDFPVIDAGQALVTAHRKILNLAG